MVFQSHGLAKTYPAIASTMRRNNAVNYASS
jgi:hypothetical protein